MTDSKRQLSVGNIAKKSGLYYVALVAIPLSILFKQEIRQGLGVEASNDTIEALTLKEQTPEFIKKTAYHEAAHAVTAMVFNRPHVRPDKITIKPEKDNFGYVSFDMKNGQMATTREDYQSILTILYAGTAADSYFSGSYEAGNSQDIETATEMAQNMIKYGMGKYVPMDYQNLINTGMLTEEVRNGVADEVVNTLFTAHSAALEIVSGYADHIQKLAEHILENPEKELTFDEVAELLGYDKENGLVYTDAETGEKYYVDAIATFFSEEETPEQLENTPEEPNNN